MRKTYFILILIITSLLMISCKKNIQPQLSDNVKSGLRADAKEFMESLKSILMKEIQTSGIVSAVSVCSDTAQLLTNDYGIKKGIYIKRVSFKNRNPHNYPDKLESKALNYFQKLKDEGNLKEDTEYFEILEENGSQSVHYLKPIIVQAPCLNCHGKEAMIIPEVQNIIKAKYPVDKATGYEVGDLRGAVSIRKSL